MSKLSDAKIFGGIGALLSLVGVFVPTVGSVLGIIGLVLILVAVNKIAQLTNNHDIFKNYLFYVILNIVALVAVIAIFFAMVGGIAGIMDLTQIAQQGGVSDPTQFFSVFGSMITACILALVIGWIVMIIAAVFLRKSYNAIAERTKVDMFRTTGLVYLIGAATLIIFIGVIILLIAKILEIIAFFSLPETLPGEPTPAAQTESPTIPPS